MVPYFMNAASIAQIIIGTAQVYLVIGLIFAILFMLFWIQRVDPAAHGST